MGAVGAQTLNAPEAMAGAASILFLVLGAGAIGSGVAIMQGRVTGSLAAIAVGFVGCLASAWWFIAASSSNIFEPLATINLALVALAAMLAPAALPGVFRYAHARTTLYQREMR
jgi:energy-converting hydrogenase Eha subunit C